MRSPAPGRRGGAATAARTASRLATLLGLLVAAMAAASPLRAACPTVDGESFGARIELDIARPEIVHSYSRADLGTEFAHGAGNSILGLHAHGIQLNYQIEMAALPADQGHCIWARNVTVVVEYTSPRIMIAREYPVESCNYKAILEHELQHAAVARDMIARHRTRFERSLATLSIPKYHTPLHSQDIETGRQAIAEAVDAALHDTFLSFRQALAEAQAQVDSPEEYRRVAQKCARW